MTTPQTLRFDPPSEDDPFDRLEVNAPDVVVAAVHTDLQVGLATVFTPEPHPDDNAPALPLFEGIFVDEARIEPGTFGPIAANLGPIADEGAQTVALAWQWDVRHSGPFFGIAATNRPVRLRGTTIIRRNETNDDWVVNRTIDWLDALGQMGVTVAARSMPIAPPDDSTPAA